MHEAFADADILLAPAVVGEAPRFDQPLIEVGVKWSLRVPIWGFIRNR